MEPTPIWSPSQSRIINSNLTAFIDAVNRDFGMTIHNYEELYQWSINSPEIFWQYLLLHSGIILSGSTDPVVSGRSIMKANWFENVRINYAENLLKYSGSSPAIISISEKGTTRPLTHDELRSSVYRLAKSLADMGVVPGDRVAGMVVNSQEAVIAMLATAAVGAIWSSCSPDFGSAGIIDRFSQIEPKVFFACLGYHYNNTWYDCSSKIKEVVGAINSISVSVLIQDVYKKVPVPQPLSSASDFDALITSQNPEFSFPRFGFDHPLFIMYSSGTTGKPKCIVHGIGGTLLQHYKEHYLHIDLKPGDKILYYTTCGWMMWNWLVSALQTEATIVLYDGNPAHPDISTLWRIIAQHKIKVFGTSPKFLSACEKAQVNPGRDINLEHLSTILSTGSPLMPHHFDWIYSAVGKDIHLASISGGTDIISCFVLGNPIQPVFRGEIQCRGLGMAVDVYDENGSSVRNLKGDLVCTQPFPSRPLFFWNDSLDEKYISSYFSKFPDVWHHGDYISINSRGGCIIYGRSDAALNPGGVRIGTAEIYQVVETFPYITDSLVVGQTVSDDVRIILFVVMDKDLVAPENLFEEIKSAIRERLTARHIPAKIIIAPEVPHTKSGKKVELAVTKILNGETVENTEALVNPLSLEFFKNIEELQR